MSVSNETKTGVATFTNDAKNAASPVRQIKTGSAWLYDDANLTYDGATDPSSGSDVYYDSLGILPIITNETKHTA